MRIKLTIAYEGTRYCGWQVQPNGVSIQKTVQNALETILRHPIALSGAGRTDAGVHALGQVAHFDTEHAMEPSRLRLALNALLPSDIRIIAAESVADEFHARYSALGKIYHYHLHLDPSILPHLRLYRTRVFGSFHCAALREAAVLFLGTHDFRSFANGSGKSLEDSVRTLMRLDVIEQKGGVRLEFEGDGFLYKMVRNIVGTLLEVASGRRAPKSVCELFNGKERVRAGATAPPYGLFLVSVKYP